MSTEVKKISILVLIIAIIFVLTVVTHSCETSTIVSCIQSIHQNSLNTNNQILVKFQDDTLCDKSINYVKQKLQLSKIKYIKTLELINTRVYEIDKAANIPEVINLLEQNPNVLYVEANTDIFVKNLSSKLLNSNVLFDNGKCKKTIYDKSIRDIWAYNNLGLFSYIYVLLHPYMPKDREFNKQWGLHNSSQLVKGQSGAFGIDINILPAWQITMGNPEVIVGILDSGIDINHIDLKDNIFINQKEIPNNGIDDDNNDNNDYIDDTNGWDFINYDNTVFDSSKIDAHGTQVAGIIAARANNEGIIGVAPNIKMLPLKCINGYNGNLSNIIEAIAYAKKMGVKIINCSFGSEKYSKSLKDAMESSDILFVCSAGNDGEKNKIVYPAYFNLPNIISVTSIDNSGNLGHMCNWGENIDVEAPGMNVLSTTIENSYAYCSGTSFAVPHVTGIAALIKSNFTDSTCYDIANRIKSTAIKDSNRISISTYGRVNSYYALLEEVPSDE